jgi:Mg2+-importing ATPase
MSQHPSTFWSISASDLLQRLQATPQGLTSQEAQRRLVHSRANLLKSAKRTDTLTLLLTQFKSPIIIILLFAAGLSFFLHDPADALISGQLVPMVWSSFVLPHTRSHAGEGVP